MCPGFVPPCPWANGPPAGSACGDISRVPEVGRGGETSGRSCLAKAAGFMQQTWRFLMILTKQKWWFMMIQHRNMVIYYDWTNGDYDSTKKQGDLFWFNQEKWRFAMVQPTMTIRYDFMNKHGIWWTIESKQDCDLGIQNGDIARNIEAGTSTRRWGVLWEVERWGLLAK